MGKFISCVVPKSLIVVLLLWQRYRNHMDSYRVSMMNVPESPIASSNDVTPCIVMKNNGVLYHQVSFSPLAQDEVGAVEMCSIRQHLPYAFEV